MLFTQYIRPNGIAKAVEIPAPKSIEMLFKQLTDLDFVFSLEVVPQFHQIFLYADREEDDLHVVGICPQNITLDRFVKFLDKVIEDMQVHNPIQIDSE